MATETENDKAWAKAFDTFNVVQTVNANGFIDLTANELRQFREPRHMGKIDHEENLPKVFKDAGLSILTLSNSSYRVGPFDIFKALPTWEMPNDEVKTLPFPSNLETLDFKNITGEPAVINTANATHMLQDFTGEDLLLTVAGRMRTGEFEFSVDTKTQQTQKIKVSKAQMEIDAGYEGNNNFYIFEVKNHASKNFNFRQLYYPYRAWSQRINKPAVPIFLTLSNDVFDLYQFGLEDPLNFSSGHLTKHTRYMLTHSVPEKKSLVEDAKKGRTESVRNRSYLDGIPFPQADSFERVIDTMSILIDSPQTVEDLATHYGFDPRQSDYYYNALRYLGLATSIKDEDSKTEFRQPTEKAVAIFAMPYKEKYEALASEILRIETMSNVYLRWVESGIKPSLAEVIEIFKNSDDSIKAKNSEKLSPSTIERRSQTILSWVSWLIELTDEPN